MTTILLILSRLRCLILVRTAFLLLALINPVASLTSTPSSPSSAAQGDSNAYFSLSAYQKARAIETTHSLDASRFHFQILFVDNNNFHGRVAEGLLGRVAEYNDAMCILFPSSATITTSSYSQAPIDAAAPQLAIAVCEKLGLCKTKCAAMGTAFDLSYLDEYDLIIAMDDQIRSLILRSLNDPADQVYYAPKCRLLSEFLSPTFCSAVSRSAVEVELDGNGNRNGHSGPADDDIILQSMLDYDLFQRVQPFSDLVRDRSSNVFSSDGITLKDIYTKGNYNDTPRIVLTNDGVAVPNFDAGWPLVEAAMIVASTGITRFCLDTMDSQMDASFQSLLVQHFCRKEHLHDALNWVQADDQLRKSSFAVTGYFSPEQRKDKFERHIENLRNAVLGGETST
jgi:hypothetical protein